MKCKHCENNGEMIDMVKYGNCYFHDSCFIEYYTQRARSKWTKEKAYAELDKLKEDMQIRVLNISINKEFDEYICKQYDMTNPPDNYYTRMAEVRNGTYKHLINTIDIKILLEIFKENRFKEVCRKSKINKSMSKYEEFLYDLTIALNKYDQYIIWRKKMDLEKIKIKELKEMQNKLLSKVENNNNFNKNRLSELEILF